MSDAKPQPASADELAKQLQQSLVGRRVQPAKLILLALALSVLLLALLVWWLFPKRDVGSVQVIALDSLLVAGEEPTVRAQLFLLPVPASTPGLHGYTVVFSEPRLPLQAEAKTRDVLATSDRSGQASMPWPIPRTSPGEFLARHVDIANKRVSMADSGRIFAWPEAARILIVDVDETLTAEVLDEKAAAALRDAVAADWGVVYLTLTSSKAHEFRTTRGWIQAQAKLPTGPILGRTLFAGEDKLEHERREQYKSIRTRFKGQVVALVKSTETAQIASDAGLRVIMISDKAAPAGIDRATTWADVRDKLK